VAHFLLVWFLLLLYTYTQAQADTTRTLETVTITASRFRQMPVGQQVTILDSSRLQTLPSLSVAELLSQNTGIFIKSYGLGSLATSSIRGGSAGHAAVIWNGFPIQNPMLGQLDLALLPAGLMDEIQLQPGGNGALWGSGAVGGVLQLNNKLVLDRGLQIRYNSQIGSFAQFHNDIKISFSNQKFATSTRLLRQTAQNDFPYRVTFDAPRQRQQNAGFQQTALLQENRFQIQNNQHINFKIWLSQAEQHIPPTTTQNFSVAKQDNQFLRTSLDWQLVENQWIIQTRTGVFYEYIRYRDSINKIDASSHAWTSTTEAEAEWQLHAKHRLQFGLNHTYSKAEADGYPQGERLDQSAVFAAYHWQTPKWRARLSMRQALANGDFVPLVPSFGVENDVTKWLTFKANVTRNFRLPTLNDLYWQPGGNPTLQPESGWAEEATLQTHWKSTDWQFSYTLTGFNRNVTNWILWVPGDAFWSPQNIAAVWSRGLEQRISWQLTVGSWQLVLNGGYDLIRSTQQRASKPSEVSKQLIYVPEQQAFGRLAVQFQKLQLAYQHQYIGSVFTWSDNSVSLPAYQLGQVQLRQGFLLQHSNIHTFLQINNFWNTTYRVIERRRMPGRNYQLGISIHFQ